VKRPVYKKGEGTWLLLLLSACIGIRDNKKTQRDACFYSNGKSAILIDNPGSRFL
jgi:hypothetical protein